MVVKEAELKAKHIIDQGNNRVVEIRKEYDALVKEFKIFRNKFKSLLDNEIINIDQIFSSVDENCREPFEKIATYETDIDFNDKLEVATTLESSN